jgi:hypothetical protein
MSFNRFGSLRIVFNSISFGSSARRSASLRTGQSISHRLATSVSSHFSTQSGRERRARDQHVLPSFWMAPCVARGCGSPKNRVDRRNGVALSCFVVTMSPDRSDCGLAPNRGEQDCREENIPLNAFVQIPAVESRRDSKAGGIRFRWYRVPRNHRLINVVPPGRKRFADIAIPLLNLARVGLNSSAPASARVGLTSSIHASARSWNFARCANGLKMNRTVRT